MKRKCKVPKKVMDKYEPAPLPSNEEIDAVLSRIVANKRATSVVDKAQLSWLLNEITPKEKDNDT